MIVPAEKTFRVTTPTRSNAKAWAKMFEARILEPGIVSYEDAGCGKAFLKKEAIEASMHSFIGRPLILTPKLRHKKITPEQLERDARGYITEVYYNPADGWFWCKGICHDDEAKAAINRVGFCSCAYEVVKVGTGGEYHAIPYHEEILEFSGEHLAIVDSPRYEGATIRLNSKPKNTEPMNMFKWLKQAASRQNATEANTPTPAPAEVVPAAAAPAVATKENSVAEDITGDTELEIPTRENGKTAKVTLAQLVEVYNARDDGIDPNAEIEVNGKPVKFSALVEAHNAFEKKDDDDDEKKKKDKENAENAKKKENAVEAKTNFRVLIAARENGIVEDSPKLSMDDLPSRVQRGSERYGSAKTN